MSETVPNLTEQLALGIKIAGIGLGTVNYVADTITLDARAAAIFGLSADTALPRDALHDCIHSEDRAAIDHQVDDLLAPHGETFIEVTHRVLHPDGRTLWVNARKEVTFEETPDGQQRPVSGMVAIHDVTQQMQSQLKAEFLLKELNHRSKNLLTVVQSIARRTAATGDTADFNERFGQRLAGLAHNLDALVRNNWSHADLGGLVASQLEAFADTSSKRIKIDGPKVGVTGNGAQAIGMALHELATNATKYGALAVDAGTVSITWEITTQPSDGIVVTWQERGGPAVTEPTRAGFGQLVLRDMAASALNGTVDLQYRASGLFWKLFIPHSELV